MLHKFDCLLRDLTYSVLHIRCHCRSNLIAQVFDTNALYESQINPCLSFIYSPAMTLMVSRGRKLILLLLSFVTKNSVYAIIFFLLYKYAHRRTSGRGPPESACPPDVSWGCDSRLALIPQKCSERGSTDWATCFVKLLEAREAKIGMPAR